MRLKILFSIPCLCGLFVPSTPLAAQSGTAPVIRPGRVSVALDPEMLSFLPLDSGALRLNLCDNHTLPVDEWGTISPRGECNLSVAPPPGIDLFLDNAAPVGASWRVSVQPTGSSSWPASSLVDTPCGLWSVAMELDPDPKTQPVSQLSLDPSGTDPAQGVFAGVVKLAVRYRFVNSAKGLSREVPAVVPLELSGHWSAIPEGGPGLGDGASNLVLFTGFFDAQYSGSPSCGSWAGRACPVCFSPAPDVLDTLNPGFH